MATKKYISKTKEGYPILGAYFISNSETGFGPDSHTFVIAKRHIDYVIGRDYNSAEGWWLGGSYGYKTKEEAREYIIEHAQRRYGRKGRWVSLTSLYYVVDGGNHNQMDNYGVYYGSQNALAKARKLAIDEVGYEYEVKCADGEVLAILTAIDSRTVVGYFPDTNKSHIVLANGSLI